MAQIVLVSDNENTISEVVSKIKKNSFKISTVQKEEEIEEFLENDETEIIIFDDASKSIDIISLIRKLKLTLQTKDIRSILLLKESNVNYAFIKYLNSYVVRPLDENLIIAYINYNLQMRDTFSIL